MKNSIGIGLFLLLLSTYPAMASWGSFVSTGSTLVNSDVSCAQVGSGQVACAASGYSNTLVVNTFNGSTWAGWTKVAGAISSGPSCTLRCWPRDLRRACLDWWNGGHRL